MSKENDINFEEAMEKLDKIANELETGKLSLEESVTKFEEGMELSKKCNDMLDSAEKRITMLIKTDEGIEEKDFKIDSAEKDSTI